MKHDKVRLLRIFYRLQRRSDLNAQTEKMKSQLSFDKPFNYLKQKRKPQYAATQKKLQVTRNFNPKESFKSLIQLH